MTGSKQVRRWKLDTILRIASATGRTYNSVEVMSGPKAYDETVVSLSDLQREIAELHRRFAGMTKRGSEWGEGYDKGYRRALADVAERFDLEEGKG